LFQLEARGLDFATGIFVAGVIVMSSLSGRCGARRDTAGADGAHHGCKFVASSLPGLMVIGADMPFPSIK
jgi:hypothetical protein